MDERAGWRVGLLAVVAVAFSARAQMRAIENLKLQWQAICENPKLQWQAICVNEGKPLNVP